VEDAPELPLSGLRMVELSSFVATALAGMTLAQLGADVIRVDPIGGAADRRRWPFAPSGESLYWEPPFRIEPHTHIQEPQ
jgi:2-methylfumaryl-CoA isomerase